MPRSPYQEMQPAAAVDLIFGNCRDDSLVAFGAATRQRPRPCATFVIRADEIDQMFPVVFQHLVRETGYIATGTFTERALIKGPYDLYRDRALTGKPLFYRALQSNVAEMVAIVLDLDVGRDDSISPGQAIGALYDLVEAGELPELSMIAHSGRGLYAWWLLKDDDGRPPLCTDENVAIWKKVVATLLQRTEHLEADASSSDYKHWYKLPGTRDFKTGNRVRYMPWVTGERGGPLTVPRYELPEMIQALDIPHLPSPDEVLREYIPIEFPDEPRERKGKGRTRGNPGALESKRIREIELVAIARGGFREGCRGWALFHLYHARRNQLLIRARDDGDDGGEAVRQAKRETVNFNRECCNPPLPIEDVRKAWARLSRRAYRPHNSTIAGHLKVTDEEVVANGLECLLPARISNVIKEAHQKRVEAKKRLQALVDQYLVAGLSLNEVTFKVNGELGPGATNRNYVGGRRRRLKKLGELPTKQGRLA